MTKHFSPIRKRVTSDIKFVMFYCLGALRIAGNGNYGRLEFLYDDVWGTICRGKFGNEDAVVACRQLKLEYVTKRQSSQ